MHKPMPYPALSKPHCTTEEDNSRGRVLDAYGWQDCSGDHRSPRMDGFRENDSRRPVIAATILTRLVALNHERAAEEQRSLIRWLRPDFHAPGAATAQQTEIGLSDNDSTPDTAFHGGPGRSALPDWPAELPEQVAVIRKLLPSVGQDSEALAACFGRKSQKCTAQITAILNTLKALGHIH